MHIDMYVVVLVASFVFALTILVKSSAHYYLHSNLTDLNNNQHLVGLP
jgi:hypothetical protein